MKKKYRDDNPLQEGNFETGANAKQKGAVEWLRREIIKHQGGAHRGYEYKRFDVKYYPHIETVCVISEVGMTGDEGTMAQMLCRDRRQIWIGPRGGMRLLNPARYDKKSGDILPCKIGVTVRGRAVIYNLAK